MRLPGPRPWRAEPATARAAAARASGRSLALPDTANRELPRHPREVARLIREPVRKSGALQTRISKGRSEPELGVVDDNAVPGKRRELCIDAGRIVACPE